MLFHEFKSWVSKMIEEIFVGLVVFIVLFALFIQYGEEKYDKQMA